MKPLRVVLLIVGILAGMVALGLLAGGGIALWVHATERGDDGYYSTDPQRLGSDGYALVSRPLDLTMGRSAWVPKDVATFRLRSEGATDLFVGLAPTRDVRRYLARSSYTVVTDVSTDPFRATYRHVDGPRAPENPRTQDFWVATAREGLLEWSIRGGEWSVVVMNVDASPGVTADVSVGVRTALLLPIGVALLVVGLLLGIAAAAMIRAATRRRPTPRPPAGATPSRPDVPARP